MANIVSTHKSGFLLRGGRQRRMTQWLFAEFSSDTMSASATAVLAGSLNVAALAMRPFTIVRWRGRWRCRSDQVAASELYVGNIGVAVVSDQAVAVGVTAVPTPATDLGSDLFLNIDQWLGRFALVGTSISEENADRAWELKAMRKVNDDQDVIITKEAGIGGSGVIVESVGRFLIKLH